MQNWEWTLWISQIYSIYITFAITSKYFVTNSFTKDQINSTDQNRKTCEIDYDEKVNLEEIHSKSRFETTQSVGRPDRQSKRVQEIWTCKRKSALSLLSLLALSTFINELANLVEYNSCGRLSIDFRNLGNTYINQENQYSMQFSVLQATSSHFKEFHVIMLGSFSKSSRNRILNPLKL